MQFLLDTDTCIDLLRGVALVVKKMEALSPDDCAISATTVFELFAGAARARDPAGEAGKITELVAVIRELPFDGDAARRAGALRSELEEAGTPIGPYDLLIAAHALTLDLILVSTNSREFDRVAGLEHASWRERPA